MTENGVISSVQVLVGETEPSLGDAARKPAGKTMPKWETNVVNEGVEWVILTGAVEWQVYHLTRGLPIIIDAVFTINLLTDSPTAASDQFFFLTRESMKKEQIDDLK